MPRFEFVVRQEVLKVFGGERGRFDEAGDAFVTSGSEEEETWPAEEITISDGTRIKACGLGAGSWMWEGA